MRKYNFLKKLFTAIAAITLSFSGVATEPHEGDHYHGHDHEDHHAYAHHGESHDGHLIEATEFTPEYAIKHVLDAHDWHLFDMPAGDGKYKPVSIPLPVILYADGGIHFFMSSEFEHGHAAVEKGDVSFALNEHDQVVAMKGGSEISVIDFSITKSVVAMFIALILLWLIFRSAAKFYQRNGELSAPIGIAGFVEPLILFVRDEIARPQIGEHKYMRFMPYLLTVFFFIWVSNLVGLLPFGFNLTGNIAVTFTLAIFTFILTNINGNKDYWGHVFAPPGVPVALLPIMIPIELAGLLIKPAALMIRLFANITAGHIVVMSLIGVMFKMESIGWAGLSVPMTLFVLVLELLVAALQAYVFTMLSALFIGSAVKEHAHH